MKFATIEDAIEELQSGKMLVIVDDEDRENEGDVTIAAEKLTPEIINFMAVHARGLICLALTASRCDALRLPMMVGNNTSTFNTAFCVSIEARHKVSTGISAADRAATVLTAIDPESKPEDLSMPGHMFPLRARNGGVLRRTGHTEAIVDLARISGLYPAGVICEIMNPDGTMARVPELHHFAKKLNLKMVTVADIVQYRMKTESFVKIAAETTLPTRYGTFKLMAYENEINNEHHLALVMGTIDSKAPVLVRVHSQCVTGEVFHSDRCDCGLQLDKAMEMIAEEKNGVLLYLHQEGRGIGLINKLKAYELQDQGKDTVEANLCLGYKPDQRNYGVGAQILRELGVSRMRLMTNNPRKFVGLKGYGLEISERIPIEVPATETSRKYLKTKKEKLGHYISSV